MRLKEIRPEVERRLGRRMYADELSSRMGRLLGMNQPGSGYRRDYSHQDVEAFIFLVRLHQWTPPKQWRSPLAQLALEYVYTYCQPGYLIFRDNSFHFAPHLRAGDMDNAMAIPIHEECE